MLYYYMKSIQIKCNAWNRNQTVGTVWFVLNISLVEKKGCGFCQNSTFNAMIKMQIWFL